MLLDSFLMSICLLQWQIVRVASYDGQCKPNYLMLCYIYLIVLPVGCTESLLINLIKAIMVHIYTDQHKCNNVVYFLHFYTF